MFCTGLEVNLGQMFIHHCLQGLSRRTGSGHPWLATVEALTRMYFVYFLLFIFLHLQKANMMA